ncbi:MAG: MFS transporter, partial [Burkholderiales bacterium]
HMAALLNELFFPKTDSNTQLLLSALNFSVTFFFRPIGALIFGYIGDKYGRKLTIMLTTVIMSVTCFVMTYVPTYAQIGISAAWIVMTCRVIQGMSSMGEIVGAQLFLTETIPLPTKYPAVGLISIFADLGATTALGIATLVTAYGFNWRLAFMIGACIAFVGAASRTALRESQEFADAKRRIRKALKEADTGAEFLAFNPFYNQKVNKKTAFAYFLIKCTSPIFLYFIYFYSGVIFKNNFGYQPHQLIMHNLLVAIIQLFGWSILRTYLSTRIYPLKILQTAWVMSFIFIPFLPFLLKNLNAVWQLFLIQIFLVVFWANDLPAVPIFFKNFPVFKRFSYASVLYALAYALIYIITSFGLTYLIDYFGYWGLLVIMVPALIGYGYGLNHFKQLEIAAGRYPGKSAPRSSAEMAA